MGVVMPTEHDWFVREINSHDEMRVIRLCRRCYRAMVKLPDAAEWTAIHLGPFDYDLLDEITTARWLVEECTTPISAV